MSNDESTNDPELARAMTLERYKTTLAGHQEHYKQRLAASSVRAAGRAELLKISNSAVVEFGRSTLRGALILNGGGALASSTLLAASVQRGTAPEAAKVLAISLVAFGIGALLPVIATGFSYLAQRHFSEAMNARQQVAKAGTRWNNAAIALLWLSGLCFIGGTLWNAWYLPGAVSSIVTK